MQTTFRIKKGARIPAKAAPAIGERLQRIEKQQGEIKPQFVVDDARSPRSPLHPFFEWDDTKAAGEHRLEQARALIRSIEIVVEDGNRSAIETRAWVHVNGDEDDRDGAYVGVLSVMSDADSRAALVARALDEAESWHRRYAHLNELANVFDAIGKAKRKAA